MELLPQSHGVVLIGLAQSTILGWPKEFEHLKCSKKFVTRNCVSPASCFSHIHDVAQDHLVVVAVSKESGIQDHSLQNGIIMLPVVPDHRKRVSASKYFNEHSQKLFTLAKAFFSCVEETNNLFFRKCAKDNEDLEVSFKLLFDASESRQNNTSYKLILDSLEGLKDIWRLSYQHLTFSDRPIAPFGDESDFCASFGQTTTSLASFASGLEKARRGFGGDTKEAQLLVLVAALQQIKSELLCRESIEKKINLNRKTIIGELYGQDPYRKFKDKTKNNVNVVIMNTDSLFHTSNDEKFIFLEDNDPFLLEFQDFDKMFNEVNLDDYFDCALSKYPTFEEIRFILNDLKDIYFIFIVPINLVMNYQHLLYSIEAKGIVVPIEFTDSIFLSNQIIEAVGNLTCLSEQSHITRKNITIHQKLVHKYFPLVFSFLKPSTRVNIVFALEAVIRHSSEIERIIFTLPSAIKILDEIFPNARFGIASFSDKNFLPYGTEDDTCFYLNQNLTSDIGKIAQELNSIKLRPGGDEWQGHLDAVFEAIVSPEMGWGDDQPIFENLEQRDFRNVIILLSSSAPHLAGDWPVGDNAKDDIAQSNSPLLTCETSDYVSLDVLSLVMEMWGVTLSILATTQNELIWSWVAENLPMAKLVMSEELEPLSEYIVRAVVEGIWA
eukprot:GHVP01025703.1.p1 GENE.GHVP01025703.1~~GHVP01025703.1.p1  ORF type:complete len:665 (+),score=122.72 GHVP01025703.1:141-2135(+)